MNSFDVKRLAQVLAIQAEIEGMKVENLLGEKLNQFTKYDELYFKNKAKELRVIASKHDDEI